MAIFIDPPAWSAHGRLWSHLVSDVDLAELHEFAAANGIPRRGFERDHYDVPDDMYDALVAAGAHAVTARDVVRMLRRSGLRKRKKTSMATRAVGNALLRPRRLHEGDLVAIPATAGVVPEDRLRAGMQRLEGWGLRVRLEANVLTRHADFGYLAGLDADRAAGFTQSWMDPDAAAVMLARGGYGTQRILDLLDWKRLAEAEPKVLIGFSDVTALHQAFASRLGLATVYSHVVTSLGGAEPPSADELRRLLMEPEEVSDLFAGRDVEVVVPGAAEGVLVGGNLALLAAEVGTRFSRPAAGGIAVLEDVDEEPYRVDRLVTQLLRSGWFDDAEGIVLGAFTGCGEVGQAESVLVERLSPLGVPLVKGFDVGHTSTSATVPLGVRASLLATPEGPSSLRLQESALA